MQISYTRISRKKGFSKNNFYTLYDIAMLGIIFYSKIPLRIATIFGFSLSLITFFTGIIYFIYKIIFWDRFQAGIIPLLLVFLFGISVLLFFLGLIGEYLIFIHMRVANRPLVFEKERINFNNSNDKLERF